MKIYEKKTIKVYEKNKENQWTSMKTNKINTKNYENLWKTLKNKTPGSYTPFPAFPEAKNDKRIDILIRTIRRTNQRSDLEKSITGV